MSRPPKIHKPIKGAFNNILASIAAGTGKGKKVATKSERHPTKSPELPPHKKP